MTPSLPTMPVSKTATTTTSFIQMTTATPSNDLTTDNHNENEMLTKTRNNVENGSHRTYIKSQLKRGAETSKDRIRKALERQRQDRFQAQQRGRASILLQLNKTHHHPEEPINQYMTTDINVSAPDTLATCSVDAFIDGSANKNNTIRNPNIDTFQNNQNKTGKGCKKQEYANQLMNPEGLTEMPSDFMENWLAVPYPAHGTRCLVVASQGKTTSWLSNGELFMTFSSSLPGGSPQSAKKYSILDCIFHHPSKSYYILDMLCWNTTPLFECDAEFRSYWLVSKASEMKLQGTIKRPPSYSKELEITTSDVITLPFHILPRYPCTTISFEEIIKTFNCLTNPNQQHLQQQRQDYLSCQGILFYHKQSLYVPGETVPLLIHLDMQHLQDLKEFMIMEMNSNLNRS